MINNPSYSTLALFEGFDESGKVPSAAESVSGLEKVDDKTLVFKAKAPVALSTFENTIARYVLTLPKHILGKETPEALQKSQWFNAPEVVNGPYRMVEMDPAHYVSYTANPSYFRGEPKIKNLNIRILAPTQILAGLRSGEIDLIQGSMTSVPQEDRAVIAELDGVNVYEDEPMTSNMIFINTENIPDARVRQAILYAIDREQLLSALLGGKGALVDGFQTPASPYYDAKQSVVTRDVEKAKALLAEAAWDSGKQLTFKINSGDQTFANAANVIVAELAEVGIKAQIQSVDINSLLAAAGSHDFDLLAVQYTLTPVDPYPDVQWLVASGKSSWTAYDNPAMVDLVAKTQTVSESEIASVYQQIDQLLQKDVPLINTYVSPPLGAVAKRLKNAHAHVYGFFNHVEAWTLES